MGYPLKPARIEFPVYLPDFFQMFFQCRSYANPSHGMNRIPTIFSVTPKNCRDDGTMNPCLNHIIIEKAFALQSQMPCLCVVEKFLELEVGNGGSLLMRQVYEGLGYMGRSTRCHVRLLS